MMGHVPDFTYFKFGEGYNLVQAPDEYKTNALEVGVGMGRPLGDYKRTGWLLNRVFEKGYVVTNLGTNSASWRAPEKLELWNGGMYLRTVDKGNQYLIGPQDASFFLKPDEGKGGQSPLPEPLPAVSPSPEASLEPSPSLEPEMSCRDYCIEVEGRQDGGWCAYQASNCAVNGGEYFSSGDAYCEESRSCCCKSDQAPVLTCRQYCQNQGYDRGWCAFKPANCEPAGGKYYSDGDEYCSADRSNCCCRND